MNSVNKTNDQESVSKKALARIFIFPSCVVVFYGILIVIDPHKALMGLKASGSILLTVSLPLFLVFMIMLVLHLFVTPSQIIRWFGRNLSIKGTALSIVTGIISMGPIYVWYPLLKKLREEGAGTGPITIFLYSRAVKPFLLPIMIASFGWAYVIVLTLLTVLTSIATGWFMSVLMNK